jgi:hypothetical protein
VNKQNAKRWGLVKLLEKAKTRHHPHSGQCITCELIATLAIIIAAQPDAEPVAGKDIDSLISTWSMRPKPNTPAGEAWEAGARQGWQWAMDTAPPSGVREGMHEAAGIAAGKIIEYSGNNACANYVAAAILAAATKLPETQS